MSEKLVEEDFQAETKPPQIKKLVVKRMNVLLERTGENLTFAMGVHNRLGGVVVPRTECIRSSRNGLIQIHLVENAKPTLAGINAFIGGEYTVKVWLEKIGDTPIHIQNQERWEGMFQLSGDQAEIWAHRLIGRDNRMILELLKKVRDDLRYERQQIKEERELLTQLWSELKINRHNGQIATLLKIIEENILHQSEKSNHSNGVEKTFTSRLRNLFN